MAADLQAEAQGQWKRDNDQKVAQNNQDAETIAWLFSLIFQV